MRVSVVREQFRFRRYYAISILTDIYFGMSFKDLIEVIKSLSRTHTDDIIEGKANTSKKPRRFFGFARSPSKSMARKKASGIEPPRASVPKAMQSKPKVTAPAPQAKAPQIKSAAAKTKAPAPKVKLPAAETKANPARARQVEATNGRSILNLRDAVNGSVTADQIAERAYFHWLERGCPFGSPEEDWLYAEQELGLRR